MDSTILCLYMLVLGILGAFGFHRAFLLYLYWRHRSRRIEPLQRFKELPLVTVQLPMFNEMYVAERLLEGVAALDYPQNKLEILCELLSPEEPHRVQGGSPRGWT
jgi:cellulose synthase/poly-beta-1,6-N-acetylglucosamine synthase-like glycosyltransferase